MDTSGNVVIAVLFAVAAVYVEALKLPSYIHTCHRNDPKLEDCILSSVESLKPLLIKGIPELELPSLDPLTLGEMRISMGGPATFNAVGRNVTIKGASDYAVSHFRVDLVKHEYAVHVELPWLMTDGMFDIDGKFLVLPIRGKGPIRANATKVRGELTLRSDLVTYDGVEHLTFISADVDLKVGGFSARLKFENDPVLSEAANIAVATAPQEFLSALMPSLEDTLGKVLLETANKITRSFSYSEIFPAT